MVHAGGGRGGGDRHTGRAQTGISRSWPRKAQGDRLGQAGASEVEVVPFGVSALWARDKLPAARAETAGKLFARDFTGGDLTAENAKIAERIRILDSTANRRGSG